MNWNISQQKILTSSGCPKSLYETCALEWSLPAQAEEALPTSAQQGLTWSVLENEKQ